MSFPRLYELACEYDARQSFYGKAQVEVGIGESGDPVEKLYSYGTPIAAIENDTIKRLFPGDASLTTGRHINEFLRQHGVDTNDKDAISSRNWNQLEVGKTYKLNDSIKKEKAKNHDVDR